MKILLIGYGKMGKAIEREALRQGHEVVLVIHSRNKKELTKKNIQQADVAIEFSQPEAAYKNIRTCIAAGVPVVSGTTGWLDKKKELKKYCHKQKGAFLYASNFSIGVNIFFYLNKMLAKLNSPKALGKQAPYQARIEEIHHTQKLDAPSGTAITLAKDIIAAHPTLSNWALGPIHQDDELPITAKRIAQVPGTHIVTWQSDIDCIEIKHCAYSRKGFVQGALLAAEWLIGKKGCFGMEDVLEIN